MLSNLSLTTKLVGAIIAVVIIITVVMIAVSSSRPTSTQKATYVNDNASADNKVEALKTMTADLLAVEDKNKKLAVHISQLQANNKKMVAALKQSVSEQVQQALQQIEAQNQQKQQRFEDGLKQKAINETQSYSINGTDSHKKTFIWVADISKGVSDKNLSHKPNALFNVNDDNANSLLPSNDNGAKNLPNNKNKVKPIYTIPVNATLTGATLMTPLVGRIPIDGRLPSPYHFKLVLSANNLTANGYPMPGVKGAVMSGVASGDMLGSCVRGDIHSITFIFNDGTISTTEAKGDSGSLGYISSQTGNPCIAGTFHSNAAIFLGSQMALAGAEGYANALTSSQYTNSVTSEGTNISTLIGNANKAAFGQGASAASQAAQTWWNERVQNSFDYVYVPNVNPKRGQAMKVAVNITQQIPINYDSNARKVDYATFEKSNTSLD